MGPEWIMTPENEFVRVSSIVSAFIGKVSHQNGEDDTTLVIVDVNNNHHIIKRYNGCGRSSPGPLRSSPALPAPSRSRSARPSHRRLQGQKACTVQGSWQLSFSSVFLLFHRSDGNFSYTKFYFIYPYLSRGKSPHPLPLISYCNCRKSLARMV